MIQWASLFFVIALAAALVGFGGIAAGTGVAKELFFIFGALFLLFLFGGLTPGRSLGDSG